MDLHEMIIAIDGPAGSGKTATAKRVAGKLGFMHINTGAMYRGLTLKFLSSNFDFRNSNHSLIQSILNDTVFEFSGLCKTKLFMDGSDISDSINNSEVTNSVSEVSAISQVRDEMVKIQRNISIGGKVVLEGRDIGSVVFPNADFKFFLIAELETRALRRMRQLERKGTVPLLPEIIKSLRLRDQKDMSRLNSPLIKAENAIELDTTNLTLEGQVDYIINIINNNQQGA